MKDYINETYEFTIGVLREAAQSGAINLSFRSYHGRWVISDILLHLPKMKKDRL